MKQLERLTVLVHPGYCNYGPVIAPEEATMLRSIEKMTAGIAQREREALLILLHLGTQEIEWTRNNSEDPDNVVLDMCARIQETLRAQCARIDGAGMIPIGFCINYLESTRTALEHAGFTLNNHTLIEGIGETPAVCVPHIIGNFATLMQSIMRPKVLLDYTNAARPAVRDIWMPNGWKLQLTQTEYPGVDFVPLGTHKGVLEAYEDA